MKNKSYIIMIMWGWLAEIECNSPVRNMIKNKLSAYIDLMDEEDFPPFMIDTIKKLGLEWMLD